MSILVTIGNVSLNVIRIETFNPDQGAHTIPLFPNMEVY